MTNSILLGNSVSDNSEISLATKFGNRHGLVTGATGTGKTVTLQNMMEGFSNAGIPVFAADAKTDLSGVASRSKDVENFPVVFWDIFGISGHRVRTSVESMGALLFSRLLDVSEAQEGVLNVAFKLASDRNIPLITLKNFRDLLNYMSENAEMISGEYGLVTKNSLGSIQRALLVLEQQGGDMFFGSPALDINDLIHVDKSGKGRISLLAADKLMLSPLLYSTFMLWLLTELFRTLPEVGNPDKPKIVFFFDEAHLLFADAPKALLTRVEQVVRLIRSKGVGIYFITQNPLDVPETVLAQLGNRVQHALRAYTPREQKAVKAAAETFRANPAFDCGKMITSLNIGEALVSVLEDKGTPSMVQHTMMRFPSGQVGPITDAERASIIGFSPLGKVYDKSDVIVAPRASKPVVTPSKVPVVPAKPVKRPAKAKKTVMERAISGAGKGLGRALVRGFLKSLK